MTRKGFFASVAAFFGGLGGLTAKPIRKTPHVVLDVSSERWQGMRDTYHDCKVYVDGKLIRKVRYLNTYDGSVLTLDVYGDNHARMKPDRSGPMTKWVHGHVEVYKRDT